jgi:hypothetical protein
MEDTMNWQHERIRKNANDLPEAGLVMDAQKGDD